MLVRSGLEITLAYNSFGNFGVHHTNVGYVLCDYQGVIYIGVNLFYFSGMDYIEIDYRFVRTEITNNTIFTKHIQYLHFMKHLNQRKFSDPYWR